MHTQSQVRQIALSLILLLRVSYTIVLLGDSISMREVFCIIVAEKASLESVVTPKPAHNSDEITTIPDLV